MKQNLGTLTAVEDNLFVDSHGRKIVFDRWTKKAYVLKKEQLKRYGMFANRAVMSVLLVGFAGFYFNWIWGIVLGVLLTIVLELFYRKGFLNNLEEIEVSEIPAIPSKAEVLARAGKRDNIVKLICGIVLPLLLAIYVLMVVSKAETVLTVNNVVLFIFSAAASIYALYIAFVSVKALQIIKKEGK